MEQADFPPQIGVSLVGRNVMQESITCQAMWGCGSCREMLQINLPKFAFKTHSFIPNLIKIFNFFKLQLEKHIKA
jgi:hypothetical protein